MKREKQTSASERLSSAVVGAIVSDALYRADELKARMGWKDAAFRAACRKGLKVHRVGKRAFVTGSDIIAFVTGNGGER
jgi:hypothetical protein